MSTTVRRAGGGRFLCSCGQTLLNQDRVINHLTTSHQDEISANVKISIEGTGDYVLTGQGEIEIDIDALRSDLELALDTARLEGRQDGAAKMAVALNAFIVELEYKIHADRRPPGTEGHVHEGGYLMAMEHVQRAIAVALSDMKDEEPL